MPGVVGVYNLAVAGEPEYFANGVLVHNCDASSAGFNLLTQGGMAGKPAVVAGDRTRELARALGPAFGPVGPRPGTVL